MLSYLLRRMLQMIPTLAGVILLVFFLFTYFGGDPAEILGGLQATPEQIESIRNQLGLDEPIYVQYGKFVSRLAQGDLGESYRGRVRIGFILRRPLQFDLGPFGKSRSFNPCNRPGRSASASTVSPSGFCMSDATFANSPFGPAPMEQLM